MDARLRSSRAPAALAGIGLFLALPTIAIGFYADDLMLTGALERRLPFNPPWWDLYRLIPANAHAAQLEHGFVPWWSAPHLHIRFVRPLASALLGIDHALFGDAPLGYHLHSLVWWAALLAIARVAFEAWLPPPTSTLALAVYAFSTAHGYPVGWASARHELVATVCVAGGLALMTAGGGETATRRWRALGAFVMGLAASEGAIGGLAFAVMLDVAGPAAAFRSWQARLRRAAPWGLTALAYLACYASVDGGARESGGYFSPLASPGRFVQVGILRYPVFLANALAGVPAEFAVIGAARAVAILGVVAAGAVALLWRLSRDRVEAKERDAIRWLLPGALMAVAACLGAFPGARVLEIGELGFAALIAVILRHAFSRGPHAALRRSIGGLLAALHLVLSPLAVLANLAATVQIRQKTDLVAEQAAAAIEGADHALLLAASDPMVSVYAPLKLASGGRAHGCWSWISGAKADVRLTRTSLSTVTVEPLGITLMNGPFETLYRDPAIAFHEGDEVAVCGETVTVRRVEGGLPAAIEIRVDEMDEPRVALLAWQDGALRRLAAPKVGASVVIPWSPGPSGFF